MRTAGAADPESRPSRDAGRTGEELHPQVGYWISDIWRASFSWCFQ
jgi:hypothetical protein